MITIFTPTYNRAYLLNNAYQSLLLQTKIDFEWIIVDDGSTDSTEELISEFISQNKINIRYIRQQNKGKHFAINRGVEVAKGELFLILDSDDVLPERTLDIVCKKYLENQKDINFGGVAGRKAYFDNTLVGSKNDFKDLLSNALDIRYKHNLRGDLAEVFKTSVLREFPFPEIENEKFCPEALVWNRIAQKYNLLYFNDIIYKCEYLSDGLTSKITKIRMESPLASMLAYSELSTYKIPFIEKIKATINFWRFSFNSNSVTFFQKIKMINLTMTIFTFPIGLVMYILDKKQFKNRVV